MADISTLPLPAPRNIMFSKDVTQSTIESISSEILNININDRYLSKLYKIHGLKYIPEPIQIYIDSYGGLVYQIMGLISIIKTSKTPVHTIATGCAMSCGYMLLINGHKRFAYELATILYHAVSSGTHGQVQHLKEDLDETTRLQNLLEQMTLDLTNITAKQLKKIKQRKIDWFITSKEAKKLNIVDKILK